VLRVGVLGLGAVAQAVYLPLLARRPDRFRVVAMCDLSEDLLAAMGERYGVAPERCFTEVASMLSAGQLDALLVLSSGSHASAAAAGLDAGLAVLCEKPLAYSLEEVARLRRTTGADRRLQLGYMKLYDPAFAHARAVVEQHPVRSVEVTVLHPTAGAQLEHANVLRPADVPAHAVEALVAELHRAEEQALGRAAAGGLGRLYSGILLGSIVHDLALVRALVGDPVRIEHAATWPEDAWPPSVEVVGVLPRGARLSIRWHYLVSYPAYREELHVHFDSGSVSLRFPAPYLLHAPTVMTAIEADGSAEQVTRKRSTVEAFEEQLLAFRRMAVDGVAPAAGLDAAEADVRTCQRIAARLAVAAGVAIGGEAAEHGDTSDEAAGVGGDRPALPR
jgi:predicted dehydrogenase